MTRPSISLGTLDEIPEISQKLKLICTKCATRASYDVGTIFCDVDEKGEISSKYYGFTNYFHCKKCRSSGPWEIDDWMEMVALALRLKLDCDFEGFRLGRCVLFDGTFTQTPAMGEEHLLNLLHDAPGDVFLHTRLGNLLRGCHMPDKAAEWYAKALALDPGDIEARYHLFMFAVEAEDVQVVLGHAPQLVRHLLEGRRTDKDDLMEGLVLSVVDNLMAAPEEFRQHFLARERQTSQFKEDIFIRTLLAQEGDKEAIAQEAAQRLLDGEPEPATDSQGKNGLPGLDLVPSLSELVQAAGLDPERLTVAFETDGRRNIRLVDRHTLTVSDGQKMASWPAASLRELFRGNRQPPPDMDNYPDAYTNYFFEIENQILTLCDAMGDRTDQELEEIYSALRRRPDGRSLGIAHDYLWQVIALLLGSHPLSEAEFDALIGALIRSTRKWGLRPVSRNYVGFLRDTFGDAHSSNLRPR